MSLQMSSSQHVIMCWHASCLSQIRDGIHMHYYAFAYEKSSRAVVDWQWQTGRANRNASALVEWSTGLHSIHNVIRRYCFQHVVILWRWHVQRVKRNDAVCLFIIIYRSNVRSIVGNL